MSIAPATAEASAPAESRAPAEPFRHEALLYSGDAEFVQHSSAFVRRGVDAGEPVLVLVSVSKIEMLRDELGDLDARRVRFGDMTEIGRNPARIISVWRHFVQTSSRPGRRVRGIGEPIWAERTFEELVESQRHESLINLAFAGAPATVMCPYDLATLPPSFIDEAYHSHPILTADGVDAASATYRGPAQIDRPFDDPLVEPASASESYPVTIEGLAALRKVIRARAAALGLSSDRAEDLVLALNEVATNSLRHGVPPTKLRYWTDGNGLTVEVADRGRIPEPLVGRTRPRPGQDSGYGLWMANELCDLVQLRSFPWGSAVRVRMTRR